MAKETIDIDLWAFWSQANTYLSAHVTKMNAQGMVYAPSYQGWFKPVRLLPPKAGKKVSKELVQLKTNLDLQIQDASSQFKKAAEALVIDSGTDQDSRVYWTSGKDIK